MVEQSWTRTARRNGCRRDRLSQRNSLRWRRWIYASNVVWQATWPNLRGNIAKYTRDLYWYRLVKFFAQKSLGQPVIESLSYDKELDTSATGDIYQQWFDPVSQ